MIESKNKTTFTVTVINESNNKKNKKQNRTESIGIGLHMARCSGAVTEILYIGEE